jgi:hypothetical protein
VSFERKQSSHGYIMSCSAAEALSDRLKKSIRVMTRYGTAAPEYWIEPQNCRGRSDSNSSRQAWLKSPMMRIELLLTISRSSRNDLSGSK